MQVHRQELEATSSATAVANQLAYLETVAELSRRCALSRIMYLAAAPAAV